jgi:hypothetical protein
MDLFPASWNWLWRLTRVKVQYKAATDTEFLKPSMWPW